jgi:hypothetical protein
MSTCIRIKTFSWYVKCDQGKHGGFGTLGDPLTSEVGSKERMKGEKMKRWSKIEINDR